MNFLQIVKTFSLLLVFFSFAFLPAYIVSVIYSDGLDRLFIKIFSFVFAFGLVGWIATRKDKSEIQTRDGFFIITFFWVILALVGSLPFLGINMTYADSFFESMSGITTTGGTVIVGLDNLPESILFYRQTLQWLGGMGLIVLAVAIMPLLGIGGGQLFKTEIPGAMNEQKFTPRIKETAQALWLIYTLLTLACFIGYLIGGMSAFDAISHSLSTVSIGGFSTHDASFAYFNSNIINYICIIFMLLSALSFTLHYFAFYKRRLINYLTDPEAKFFLLMCTGVLIITFLITYITSKEVINISNLIFQTISFITTSGFTIEERSNLPFAVSFILLVAAFIGACSGSVGGGLKSWRVLIMLKSAYRNFMLMVHPKAVVTIKIGSKPVSNDVSNAVWGFFSIYVLCFMFFLFLLLILDIDFVTAFSAVGACLNNLGPGLGDVINNYQSLPDTAKYILSFVMLIGRLEIFTFLILFMPAFWSR